ncbi:unnamed protein product [marine sediment metagenome]|uniref:Uncharacterized protein n=1 Tax=marine sediment metagenome TaxID=412755 RepID=X1VKN9_9ZZZZ
MLIPQVQVGNVLYPLVEGQPLPIAVGETLRVFYSFNYRMPNAADVRIWASLYKYTLGILNRKENAQTKQTVTLEKALDWKDYSGEIDIPVGDIDPGIYGLICELPGYDVEDSIDDCLEVAAAPGIMDMIGPLLVIGLMAVMVSMMTPMMEEGVS